jgi:Mrp family chromosome partitioning ATPase/capsular polysaccharide biosynthesis protein
MLIDTKTQRFFPETAASFTNIDTSVVDSQIEILRSETIAASVVRKMNLTQDPEFYTLKLGKLGTFYSVLNLIIGHSNKPLTSHDYELNIAIANFERSLTVKRIGHSYIAEINFTSVNAKKAAQIANAIADAYIDSQLDARIYNSQRADAWIRRRMAELKENYATAAIKLEKLKASLSATSGAKGLSVDQSNERLRELESNADSYKSIYETFVSLSRYVQSVQEQSFPLTDARIITKAAPPLTKSHPKSVLILGASLMLGGLVGTAFAFAKGLRDRRIFTAIQLERHFETPCLGFIPTVNQHGRLSSKAANMLHSLGIAALLDDCDSSAGAGEVLRALRSTIDTRMSSKRCCVIGITSALPNEGKTTLAANLATVISEAGHRVLLVDGDLWNHSISDSIAAAQRNNGISKPNDEGLYLVTNGDAKLEDVVVSGPFGWCLPIETVKSQLKHPADFWSASTTKKLFVTAKAQYDYIIVDLPSLHEHVDAEAAAPLCDTFIFIVKYAQTKIDDLVSAFNSYETVTDRLLGIIVNNSPVVHRSKLKRFVVQS